MFFNVLDQINQVSSKPVVKNLFLNQSSFYRSEKYSTVVVLNI